MALIKCPKCENMLSDQATTCPNCGWTKPVHPHTTASATTKDNAPDKKKISKRLTIGAITLAVLATLFMMRGFYVKNVYDGYDTNAYVGGDAYNYIINGTYFAGFMALSGAMYICSVGLLGCSFLLKYPFADASSTEKSDDSLPSN